MVTGSTTAPAMVGRGRETATLQALLADVTFLQQPGRTAVALVSGEAGIGKSRLIDTLLSDAPVASALVGTARPGSSTTPFGLVRDMAANEVLRWDELPGPLERFARPLADLLGSLSPGAPGEAARFEADDLLFAGLALLRHLVGEGPALLVMEDLHWADPESLALFSRLADAGLPALLVGTYRPEEVARNASLAQLLDQLDRARSATRLTLEPLTVPDVAEMIASVSPVPPADHVAHAVAERTGGNPFFVEELLAALTPTSAADDDPTAVLLSAPLPWSSTEALLRRFAGLDEAAWDVLAAAAILPEPFRAPVLAEVSGVAQPELLPIVGQLVGTRILIEPTPDRFTYRHALMREAVGSRLLAWQRREMHGRALRFLRDDVDAPSSELAWHADGAGDADAASHYAAAAGEDALLRGLPRQARLVAARGLAHRSTVELHRVAARAAVQLGEVGDAAHHARRWAEEAGARGMDAERSEALCLAAFGLWAEGAKQEAWAATADARTAADASAEPTAPGWVAATRAQLHMASGDVSAAFRNADQALEIAADAADRRLRAHALVTKAMALTDLRADTHPNFVPEAAALLSEARAEAEAVGDIHTLVRALNNATMPGQGVATLDQIPDLITEGHRVIEEHGAERFAAKLASIEAWVGIVTGRLGYARDAADRPVQHRAPIDLAFWVAVRAFIDAESGDPAAASALLDEHRGFLDGLPEGEPHVDFALAEANVAAATEDATLGSSALRRVTDAVPHVTAGSAATWWDVAVCAAESGIPTAELAAVRRDGAPQVRRRNAAAAAHLDGLLALADGDEPAAIENLREAAEDPPGTRPRALVASAARQLAELLATTGDLDAARRYGARAAELLADWPGWRADAVAALQRRLGDGQRPAHELLSPREHDVALLVARGLSNREIAAELFVSPKTASTHVSNILAKTGLKRRSQVASWVVQSGMASVDMPGR